MDAEAVTIRRLAVPDIDEFWALRLRALRDHPEAYGRSYEETRDTPLAEVRRRFAADWASADAVVVGAFAGGRLVGIVGLRRHEPRRERHKAMIWGVYVAPEVRGRGIARALLAEALAQARAMPGVEQVQLAVGSRSPQARGLYAAFGFEPFGVERQAIKHGDAYVDEEHMVLFLNRASPP